MAAAAKLKPKPVRTSAEGLDAELSLEPVAQQWKQLSSNFSTHQKADAETLLQRYKQSPISCGNLEIETLLSEKEFVSEFLLLAVPG